MDGKNMNKIISLIKSGLNIKPDEISIDKKDIQIIEQFGTRQSILPIIVLGIKNLNKSDLITEHMKSVDAKAVYDYIQRRESFDQIRKVFNEHGISFIPLKGSVLCNLYTQPHLRTSADIDILVREEDVDNAVLFIDKNTSFKSCEKTHHDVQMINDHVHLELHFSILSNLDNLDCMLDKPWDYAKQVYGSYEWQFSNEYQIFYITAHAAKHFIKNGGIGIRPLIDLWLLRNQTVFDDVIVREYCNEAGILGFYESCCNLIGVWFDGNPHSDFTKSFEDLVISGGVFGSLHTYVVSNKRNKGKKYYFDRIFLKSKDIKAIYPKCKRYPIFIPFYQVVRWTHMLNSEKRKAIKTELQHSESIDYSEIDKYDKLLKSMGL